MDSNILLVGLLLIIFIIVLKLNKERFTEAKQETYLSLVLNDNLDPATAELTVNNMSLREFMTYLENYDKQK